MNLFDQEKKITLAIVGSRTLKIYQYIERSIAESPWKDYEIIEIVSGGAEGIDTLAHNYADNNKIKYKHFPAQWRDLTAKPCKVSYRKYGPYNTLAGFIRNQKIIDYLLELKFCGKEVGVIAIKSKDAKNNGTNDTIERAKKAGITIYERIF